MYKQVLVIRKDLKMGKGKIAVQASHASLEAYRKAYAGARQAWEQEGSKKVVVWAPDKEALLEIFTKARRSLPAALIRDAGLTQVAAGEETAVGIGPAPSEQVDKITGKLKLL